MQGQVGPPGPAGPNVLLQKVLVVSDAYTMTGGENVVVTSAAVILPKAATVQGRTFTLKDSGDGSGSVRGNGHDTIDGQNGLNLVGQGQCVQLLSDGSSWLIVARA